MEINNHKLTFTLNTEELSIWMCALRTAASAEAKVRNPPDPKNCMFLKQHKELCRLTGFGNGDYQDVLERLAQKNITKD